MIKICYEQGTGESGSGGVLMRDVRSCKNNLCHAHAIMGKYMTQISDVKCCEVLLVKGVVRFCMVKLREVQLTGAVRCC